MSFRRDYQAFFSIRAVDDDDDRPIAVNAAATAQCQQQLDGHQLTLRAAASGCDVFFSRNPWVSPSITSPISQRTRFDFVLNDINQSMRAYLGTAPGKLYLNNLDSTGAIRSGNRISLGKTAHVSAADHHYLVRSRLEIPLSVPSNASGYDLRQAHNTSVLHHFSLDQIGGGRVKTFDFSGLKLKRDSYRLTPNRPPFNSLSLLLDPQAPKRNAKAYVSIFVDRNQQSAPTSGYQFQIRLKTS